MDSERQRQIEALYQAARAHPPRDRAALLSGMSPDLRREVEALLVGNDAASSVTMTMAATVRSGTVLGHYEIEAPLGHGGMGQVFSAVDKRLGRRVAIKLSSEHFIDRFAREAKAISSLNHPHICTLHDVGPNYLVMELVEGETLAARIKRGKLSIGQSLEYARQIAAALAAAHAKAIIHRDLKPGNIMLSPSGVKVLDFGLAKTAGDETLTAPQAVMGTPGYMAPEQRQGKPADARTDIYAFGCVLHEMLTGARPETPGSGRIPSRELEKLVTGCLETDPLRRPQSIAALAQELGAFGGFFPHWKAIAIAALALIGLAVGGYFYLHRAPKLTDKDTIVLADFENKTGDPVFDDTLRQGLTVQLQQSPYLSLVPDQKIHAELKLMGTPAGAPITGETAREVCERVGARAMLAGTIASLGSRYVLSLRATGCANGEALDNQQEQVSGKEQVLSTLSDMAGKFRARAGESMAAIREHNVPLAEATTSSLEALKAYSLSVNLGGDEATSQLRRATELDPDFAVAWGHLAIQLSGDTALSRQAATRAWQAKDRASGPEKFAIEYSYYRNVTGDLEKAWQSISVWRQTYPHDAQAFSLSAGYAANGTGRFQEALDAAKRSVTLDPGHSYGYSNQTVALFHLGRFEETEKSLVVDAAHNAIGNQERIIAYRLAALKQDQAGMARVLAESKGIANSEMLLADVQALAAAQAGRLSDAKRYSASAIEMSSRGEFREQTAVFEAAPGMWSALYGNKSAILEPVEAALRISQGRDVSYAAGFALGLAGDAVKAEAIADKLNLNKDYREDTHVQATYVPTLRALAALARNDPRKAVDLLEANRPYEFGIPPLAFNHFYGGMYSIYVRGLAFMALHKPAEAANEFSRLLAHPGLEMGDPIDAAARRQLALAWATAGDTNKAKSAYQDFLKTWSDADPDIPMLIQAKAEFAKLP